MEFSQFNTDCSSNDIPLMERRRFIRHPLCFPLSYKIVGKDGDSSQEKRSSTLDISMGGLLFSARRPAPIGSFVNVKMPFQNKVFNIRAKVAHCDKTTSKNLYNIGVSFYRVADSFKAKLIEQLYLISEFRDLWSVQLGREVTMEEASKEWIKKYSERFRRLYW